MGMDVSQMAGLPRGYTPPGMPGGGRSQSARASKTKKASRKKNKAARASRKKQRRK